MKSFRWILVVVCLFGVLSGCHSGTMRGVGSDVSELGHQMQK